MIKLFEQFNNEQEIRDICREYGIEHYTINSDGSVDVMDSVRLYDLDLEKIPLKFGKISSYFDVSQNKLTSLEGFPKEVYSDIMIYKNKLTSLVGLPEIINDVINCSDNKLTSLEGLPMEAKGLYCSNNKITTLKGAPMVIDGDLDLRSNPISIIDVSIEVKRDIALRGTNFDDKIKSLSQDRLRILFEHGVDYDIFRKDGSINYSRLDRMFNDFEI